MSNRKAVFAMNLLAAAALCLSCGSGRGNPEASAASTMATVDVVKVVSQKLNITIPLPSELQPYEAVTIYPKVTGFVRSISVDRGSRVRKGELMAQLEAPELVAQRAQAEAQLQSSESQLTATEAKLAADESTYQKLKAASATPGVVAKNELILAEKAVQADTAQVQAGRDNVKAAKESVQSVTEIEGYLEVRAPFDGIVTDRGVHPGALVGPASGAAASTPIVRVETLTRHRLVVPVPENDVAGVPEGTKVDFTVPSFPGRVFHAPIARIAHEVDMKTRTMSAELDVSDPHAELVPGTFCEVQWPVRRTYATLFVPGTAVASNLERMFVIRIRNHRAEWVDVKTGATSGKWMEVFGDLQKGDEVATRGTDQLRAGTEVTPHPVGTE